MVYRTIGEGKPLVLLHGWGTHSGTMVPTAKMLSHLRKCYVMDLPGFGKSSEPAVSWGIGDYADLVEAFITHLDITETDLLVHSFGGRITLKLLARNEFSRKIGKVLITGGAGLKPIRSLSYYFRKYAAKILKTPLMILPGSLQNKAMDHLRETSVWKKLGSADYQKLTGVMRETFVKSVNEHLDTLLPEIHHEVLLIWGENDEATPLYQGKRMEDGLKNGALVIIESAGHYAFLDKPKQFTAIAEAFFKD